MVKIEVKYMDYFDEIFFDMDHFQKNFFEKMKREMEAIN